ncbi:MAG: acyl-ACP thioesterase [Ponticaulis sp.]|nr:acyl-ACP thioesterase [Ponticaulis sp.]|tara:strand:- start:8610 stop:9053 length:444 start_codon:yes stop_codon:yes gene_type:complete
MSDFSYQTGLGAVDFDTAFAREITPLETDFDILGHVNNVSYVRWVEETAVAHWEHVADEDLKARNVFVLLRHEIDYRDQILPGETAIARTWLGRAKGPRFERFVDIRKPRATKFSSFSRLDWCMLDIETRRPMRVDQRILEAFQVPG